MNTKLFILHLICAMLLLSAVSMTDAAITVPLPKTGQTTCWDAYGEIILDCTGTGQDGALQKGVAWPSPRFVDNNNGTVSDNLTGLIWLKNGSCFGLNSWADALTAVNALADGACSLTDNSIPGQWRLPNSKELMSLINRQESNSANWLSTTQGFTDVQSNYYWSSNTFTSYPEYAWRVGMDYGIVSDDDKSYSNHIWPVRGGISGTLVHLNISKVGYGSGSVTPDIGTLEWSGNSGLGHYLENDVVTLTAEPQSGSAFSGWSGASCSGTGSCNVTMSQLQSVTATFADSTPPDTTIISHPVNYTTNTSASFTFTSADSTATFECSLDYSAFTPCTSPKDYENLAVGVHNFHNFQVRAKDLTGNVDQSPASYAWYINPLLCDFKTGGNCYDTFADAYSATTDGIILAKAISTTESVTCNREINVSLEGGYDNTYNVTGVTTFGGMLLQSGTLTVKDVAVK